MSGSTNQVKRFVAQGYLTTTSLMLELGFNNSYKTKLSELPKPALVIDEFPLYSPKQVHELKSKHVQGYAFNCLARRFIVGEFLPAKRVVKRRSTARQFNRLTNF